MEKVTAKYLLVEETVNRLRLLRERLSVVRDMNFNSENATSEERMEVVTTLTCEIMDTGIEEVDKLITNLLEEGRRP